MIFFWYLLVSSFLSDGEEGRFCLFLYTHARRDARRGDAFTPPSCASGAGDEQSPAQPRAPDLNADRPVGGKREGAAAAAAAAAGAREQHQIQLKGGSEREREKRASAPLSKPQVPINRSVELLTPAPRAAPQGFLQFFFVFLILSSSPPSSLPAFLPSALPRLFGFG